jgi:uncharacterized protein
MITRYSAPEAERKYPWLKLMLDVFFISDSQMSEHLGDLKKKTGVVPACHEGCHACCLKPTVQLTKPELQAISWYASEVLAAPTRDVVKERLRRHKESFECPFLVEKKCSIYQVRPLICRQFLVKGKPCEVDENVAETRPTDMILISREKVAKPVAHRLLDFYKFKSTMSKSRAFENGFILENVRDMHDTEWGEVARNMDDRDAEA